MAVYQYMIIVQIRYGVYFIKHHFSTQRKNLYTNEIQFQTKLFKSFNYGYAIALFIGNKIMSSIDQRKRAFQSLFH